MSFSKQDRMLEIFFRLLRGENISLKKLSQEYNVSSKSITRSINDIKAFMADHRGLFGNAELKYSYNDKTYSLFLDEFLNSRELFFIVKVLIGCRVLSKKELCELVKKLKQLTCSTDRTKINTLIYNELHHYSEINHKCESVQENLWQLMNCIYDRKEITVEYYKMDRSFVIHRLVPLSLMFSDYYFYLIAIELDSDEKKPRYFRVDRIKKVIKHRKKISENDYIEFDEGLLRNRSLLMWPGKMRNIKFEFTGPSLQAVLDKIPTAKVLESDNNKHLIQALVYGDGIKMWLMSQGSWVRVIEPKEFVSEMKSEIEKMRNLYS